MESAFLYQRFLHPDGISGSQEAHQGRFLISVNRKAMLLIQADGRLVVGKHMQITYRVFLLFEYIIQQGRRNAFPPCLAPRHKHVNI